MKLKAAIFLPMMLLELLCIGIGWLLFILWLPAAKWWADACVRRFPDSDWYFNP